MDSTLFILLFIGIVAGILSGLVGVGGGIIMVPMFVYFLSYTQHSAQGLSLAIMLPPVTYFAVANYHKAGEVNWKYSVLVALFFTLGGFLGSEIALSIDQDSLKKVFGTVMVFAGLKMIFEKKKNANPLVDIKNRPVTIILLGIGILTGIISGLVGVGGGIVMVPLFVYILGFTQHNAQGLSLAVMLPPVTYFAVANYNNSEPINWYFMAIIALLFSIGGNLGSRIALKIHQKSLKKIFGVLQLIIALKMIFNY